MNKLPGNSATPIRWTCAYCETLVENSSICPNCGHTWQESNAKWDSKKALFSGSGLPSGGRLSNQQRGSPRKSGLIIVGVSSVLIIVFVLFKTPFVINPPISATQTKIPTATVTSTLIPTETPWPSPTGTPTKTPVPKSAILYSESLDTGIMKDWKSYYGNWVVKNEMGNNYWEGTGPANYPQAWLDSDAYNSSHWTNYAFQSRIRFIKGNIFICVRSDGGSSFYNAYISSKDNWVSFADYDGKQYNTFGDTSWPIQTNRWYTIRFEVTDNSLHLFIDDQLVTSGYRQSHQEGGIGFYMGGGDQIDIDDMMVWSLPS